MDPMLNGLALLMERKARAEGGNPTAPYHRPLPPSPRSAARPSRRRWRGLLAALLQR